MKTLALNFGLAVALLHAFGSTWTAARTRSTMRLLLAVLLAASLCACGSPQRRLASEVRQTQAKVQKTEERVRIVERTIVDREALPLSKLTLGLLEIARERIQNPPASFTMATGAAARTYDRLAQAAGPIDPEQERQVQAGLAAARAADAEPPLPGNPADVAKPAPPAPNIFAPWDAAALVNDQDLKKAKEDRAAARAAAKVTMAKAASALEEAADKDERMNSWFGLGGVLHYGSRFLFALVIGAGVLALGWIGLRASFPTLGLSAIPFRRKSA